MTPERILITGASGFVGRHLVNALIKTFPAADLITTHFDLTDLDQINSAIRAANPQSCIHLAAIATPAQASADKALAWRVNLNGTLELARAILRHAPDCQFIFASSADAYGASFRSGEPVTETTPLAPLNPYAATKAAADLALGAMVPEGLRLVRLRPFNHTGSGQSPSLVTAAFARQVALIEAGRQSPLIEVGNLSLRREMLDVRDIAAAYVACITHRDTLLPNEIINLTSGEPRPIADILDTLKDLAGLQAETRVDPTRIRAIDMSVVTGDPTHARNVVAWTTTIPWRQTMRDVLNDWRHRIR